MIRTFVYLLLTSLLSSSLVKGETFHFELVDDSFSCDDGTDFEVKLKAFNLNCVDGVGCEDGEGVMDAIECKWLCC